MYLWFARTGQTKGTAKRLPQLLWDIGTAYDLFLSLVVLHYPTRFGVRAAWAAGMRARLPVKERRILERTQGVVLRFPPLHWVHALPDPKNGKTALCMLGKMPAKERLPALALRPGMPPAVVEILQDVAARQAWDERDREALEAAARSREGWGGTFSPNVLGILLNRWARSEEFGERYLGALRLYYEVFFAEEEQRILPALQDGLCRAQDLADELALPALIEELFVDADSDELDFSASSELVLAPSYWGAPHIWSDVLSAGRLLLLFSARPPDVSLVPGEVVPDALLRALKALADPTRLRILRYLTAEPLSPSELACRLRLRAPTVVHHLNALRTANLVEAAEIGKETIYSLCTESVAATFAILKSFLGHGDAQELIEDE